MSALSALKMTVTALSKPWPHEGATLVVQRNGDRVIATHGSSSIAWDAEEYDALCLWLWMQMLGAALNEGEDG